MGAFQSPNYTQTPNDFFDMLPDMEHSEVNVTLVMIRQTFGFHRDGFKMGLNKLAAAAGLSRNAAKDGAEAAEKRGTFKRVNPDEQGEAEWSLVVEGGQPVTTPSQPVTRPSSTSDSQVGVKERRKKESNKESLLTSDDEKEIISYFAEKFGWLSEYQAMTKTERARLLVLTAKVGKETAIQIIDWVAKKEIHLTNRAGLLDSLETAAGDWKKKVKYPKREEGLKFQEPKAFAAIREWERMTAENGNA